MKTLKNNFSTAVTLIIIMGTLFFTGCEKDKIELADLDNNILNSPELEEYIVAGADLQKSLAIFTAKLKKIDLSKLEVTYDAKGRKVVHLSPSMVSNIRIEEKVAIFNEKKKALQKNFPQFTSFGKEVARNYFKHSIKNSVKVNSEFLKMGINFSRPRLKSGTELWFGEDLALMNDYLANWVQNSNYVELYIIYYADGTVSTWQSSTATATHSHMDYDIGSDGNIYFPAGGSSSAIVSIGHTHNLSSEISDDDKSFTTPSDVSRFVWYNYDEYYITPY